VLRLIVWDKERGTCRKGGMGSKIKGKGGIEIEGPG
jgi:hypothetical protein